MSDQFHQTVSKDGYEVTFHPAFASRIQVEVATGAETVLYKQQDVYIDPEGQGHPKRHSVRLRGGEQQRDLTLLIDDPKSQVARITVEFYPQGHQPGYGKKPLPLERMTVDNDAMHCPPYCDGQTTRVLEADATP